MISKEIFFSSLSNDKLWGKLYETGLGNRDCFWSFVSNQFLFLGSNALFTLGWLNKFKFSNQLKVDSNTKLKLLYKYADTLTRVDLIYIPVINSLGFFNHWFKLESTYGYILYFNIIVLLSVILEVMMDLLRMYSKKKSWENCTYLCYYHQKIEVSTVNKNLCQGNFL